jgi:hypothetical protein
MLSFFTTYREMHIILAECRIKNSKYRPIGRSYLRIDFFDAIPAITSGYDCVAMMTNTLTQILKEFKIDN